MDVDGNLSTTQLVLTNGTLTVSLAGGATISAGANGKKTLTLSRTQAQINATLATLSYQGTLNYTGPDTLTITSTVTNSGTDVDTLAITMAAVNDAPVVAANTGSTVACSGTDVGNTLEQLAYTVTTAPLNGRLELTMPIGVTITIFTQANIDAGRVVLAHNGAAVTSDSFTFTVSDRGGTGGSGGTGSGSGSGSGSGCGTGGGIVPPSIQSPFVPISTEAPITNVSGVRGTEDPAPRAVMAIRCLRG
jgi:uncharacterized membrane protein YgcG